MHADGLLVEILNCLFLWFEYFLLLFFLDRQSQPIDILIVILRSRVL